MKSQYRKFNIRGEELTPGDDFGMMKEVLTRRFKRLLKEDPDRESEAWPDLLLIDGGAGQVSAVRQIMDETGRRGHPDGRRRQGHRPRRRQGGVPPHRRVGPWRCATTTRCSISSSACATRRTASPSARTAQKRAKAVGATPLDDVPGVGATRKRALAGAFRIGQGGQPRQPGRSQGGGRDLRRRWPRRSTTTSTTVSEGSPGGLRASAHSALGRACASADPGARIRHVPKLTTRSSRGGVSRRIGFHWVRADRQVP